MQHRRAPGIAISWVRLPALGRRCSRHTCVSQQTSSMQTGYTSCEANTQLRSIYSTHQCKQFPCKELVRVEIGHPTPTHSHRFCCSSDSIVPEDTELAVRPVTLEPGPLSRKLSIDVGGMQSRCAVRVSLLALNTRRRSTRTHALTEGKTALTLK